MSIDHLLRTGRHSPDASVNDDFVDDVLRAVLNRACVGHSLEASLRVIVDHLSDGNLQVFRVENATIESKEGHSDG